MDTLHLLFDGAWRVLVWGLLLGAGLPLLFALGIRTLAWGTGGDAEVSSDGTAASPHPIGRVVSTLIFALVVVVVGLGLATIVATGFGKTVSFEHGYPTFVKAE